MDEKIDKELKEGLLLMMAAADICEEPDHTYTFKCPVCGYRVRRQGRVQWASAR